MGSRVKGVMCTMKGSWLGSGAWGKIRSEWILGRGGEGRRGGGIYDLTRPKNTPPGPTLPSMSLDSTPTMTPPEPSPSSSAGTLRSSEPAATPDRGRETLARRQLTRPCRAPRRRVTKKFWSLLTARGWKFPASCSSRKEEAQCSDEFRPVADAWMHARTRTKHASPGDA